MYLVFTIILIVAYILGIVGIKYIKKNKYCDVIVTGGSPSEGYLC